MVNKAFTPCIDAVSIPVEGGKKRKMMPIIKVASKHGG